MAKKTKKHTVNQDLKRISKLEDALFSMRQGMLPFGLSFLFLLSVIYGVHFITGETHYSTILILAGVLGAYMALNIGANDVANNVGPAVGSKALTLAGALAIAAIFEAAGAVIAGGKVVSTISKGIIDPSQLQDAAIFVRLMMAALLAAALWLNLATYIGAPVSTTHSIVGGVMGAGIAAAGMDIVNWPTMSKIAASWVISPVLGGLIAALIFKFIKTAILSQKDKLACSKRWVPILVSIMAASFTMYLMVKGFKRVWKPDPQTIWLSGLIIVMTLPILLRPFILAHTRKLENSSKGVNKLFTLPLIVSAALLSFAHGSNDVANAIGPLAAIVSVVSNGGELATKVDIPIWVMAVGAMGISVGLVLFGPKIIRTVGEKITKLDNVRAFCVALSAAITVIAASTLGLPVSSTHITVGGVFGVGLYREFSSHSRRKKAQKLSKKELKKRKLVRRRYIITIVAAWVVTVPCAAMLAGVLFYFFDHIEPHLLVE